MNLQNDFMPGGVRAVPGGKEIIALANRLQGEFKLVVATQTWHPANHANFAASHPGREPGEVVTIKGRKHTLYWPYCVQHTEGAKLAPDLQLARINKVFTTGTNQEIDSYSAFFDADLVTATGLEGFLKAKKVGEVYVAGVPTEQGVKFTALDARRLGFKTFLIEDACRGMNFKEGDVERAIEEMKLAGVKLVRSREVLAT